MLLELLLHALQSGYKYQYVDRAVSGAIAGTNEFLSQEWDFT